VVDVRGLLPEPSGCLSSSRPPVRASRVLASRAANSVQLQRYLREGGFMLVRAQTGPVREATLQRLLEQTRRLRVPTSSTLATSAASCCSSRGLRLELGERPEDRMARGVVAEFHGLLLSKEPLMTGPSCWTCRTVCGVTVPERHVTMTLCAFDNGSGTGCRGSRQAPPTGSRRSSTSATAPVGSSHTARSGGGTATCSRLPAGPARSSTRRSTRWRWPGSSDKRAYREDPKRWVAGTARRLVVSAFGSAELA